MRPIWLWILYLLAASLPLALAAGLGWPARPIRYELASALGMLAFSMILVEFILSGRFRGISGGIGMDVTMRLHQLLARTALGFAMLHPLLYSGSSSGGPRPWDPTRQLTITTDFLPIATGVLAYGLLPSLVALAMARRSMRYRYELWRLVHGLGALLIAGLLLHHTLYAGRYGAHPAMAWLWIGMTVLAAGSLIFVYAVAPILQARKPWRVSAVERLTPRQWQITVEPVGHAGLAFRAGQFAWLNIGHSAFSLHENPFSIASAPADGPALNFVIKELGDFTNTVGTIPTGTRAYVDGPHGSLTVDGRSEPEIVLIAGGVGIAPMIGILDQLRATGDRRKASLIYGNRVAEQIVHRDRLEAAGAVMVLSEPPDDWTGETGLIDARLLDRVLTPDQIATALFVLCGPGVMMDGVEDHLIARGTPSTRILSERFDYD
ncbi:ferredoxin reductase family protein [Thalassococcus sp. CAU 1522]|uniref:Ferredoxin reductase family protein n=1 Tax=Thalassococcus arenae TaxID=2851652 RepID=A0ABS6N679_9RHOB|nr:ferredoxin reductase family protein [Thalassococcus arenae]MBV2359527.1 ferredoxin reductase family protein [Thalassococcus arenae]